MYLTLIKRRALNVTINRGHTTPVPIEFQKDGEFYSTTNTDPITDSRIFRLIKSSTVGSSTLLANTCSRP